MNLAECRDQLDRVTSQRVDPGAVRNALLVSFCAVVCAGIGESLAAMTEAWFIDSDRDRLIDEARD